MLRVLAAALYFFVSIGIAGHYLFPDHLLLMALVCITVLLSAVFLFNRDLFARMRRLSSEEHFEALRQKGEAVVESYETQRAVFLHHWLHDGPTLIIEINRGEVLVLTGQYLWDFEPNEDPEEPELNCRRCFPTERFRIYRRLKNNEVMHIEMDGPVVEPLVIERSTLDQHYLGDLNFEDVNVHTGVDFEELVHMLRINQS